VLEVSDLVLKESFKTRWLSFCKDGDKIITVGVYFTSDLFHACLFGLICTSQEFNHDGQVGNCWILRCLTHDLDDFCGSFSFSKDRRQFLRFAKQLERRQQVEVSLELVHLPFNAARSNYLW